MSKKINVAVLFGGKSVEHEVSLQSGKNIIEALDRKKYNVTLIGINKQGKWHRYDEKDYLSNPISPRKIALGPPKEEIVWNEMNFDVVFPALHGTNGEDGTVQGLLELLDLPYVGAGVLGSSVGMDKDVQKRLARDASIPVSSFLTILEHERFMWPLQRVEKTLSLPLFIKPASSGSSVGISKVKTASEFEEAVDLAFQFDRKILIEETVEGIELNCAVLGNEYPIVSLPCQINPTGEFHSYASKYLDSKGAEFIIPANLSPDILSEVQTLSLKIYSLLCCAGMARVDLFLSNDGTAYFNELNTIPGLTNMSPYAKMWSVTGVSYPEMVDRLIKHAIDRHQKEQRLARQMEMNQLEWQMT